MYPIEYEYIIALILYIIAYIYALCFAKYISACDENICKIINDHHEKCIVNCDEIICKLTKTRGHNYYIDVMNKKKKSIIDKCLLTYWGLQHIILYLFLGIFAPDLFWETFIVGVLFEIYEYHVYQCHDGLDIILNTVGFVIGQYISRSCCTPLHY